MPQEDAQNLISPFLRHQIVPDGAWKAKEEALLNALTDVSEAENPLERVKALGRLGEHQRISIQHLPLAIDTLQNAVQEALKAGIPALVASNRIRLATALQYANRHEEACKEFQRAIQASSGPKAGVLLDYAHQHFGKCLAEMGQWDAALEHFTAALDIRNVKADQGLLASTREAIQTLEMRRP